MSRRWPRLAAVAVAVAVLAVAAAPAGAWWREREARRAVTRYAVALERALATLDAGELSEVATERQRTTVANYLGVFQLEGTRLESEMVSLSVESVAASSGGATVRTRENWAYRKVDAGSGRPVESGYAETVQVDYALVRRGMRLVVDDSVVRSQQRSGL